MFELKNKRLFTFGCSFTQYIWPTWADILGKQFEYFENWGLAGAGNLYIFNSIVEADKRNQFTPNDTIVIMWSGLTRSDYYHTNSWLPNGADFEFKHNDLTGYEIINYAYIHCINKFLSSRNLNYKMLSLTTLPKDSKAYDLYKDSVDSVSVFPYKSKQKQIKLNLENLKKTHFYQLLKSNYDRNKGSSWPNFDEYYNDPLIVTDDKIQKEIKKCLSDFAKGFDHLKNDMILLDSHPTPQDHLDALNKLFPNYSILESTQEWVIGHMHGVMHQSVIPFNTNFPKNRL